MDLPTAVKTCLNKYATFSGRAPRSEYWYWVLAYVIVMTILTMVAPGPTGGPGVLSNIFALLILLPSIAVGARRLHDIDKSGWWMLLAFIPIIGTIILLIWYCTKGTLGPNRFGVGL